MRESRGAAPGNRTDGLARCRGWPDELEWGDAAWPHARSRALAPSPVLPTRLRLRRAAALGIRRASAVSPPGSTPGLEYQVAAALKAVPLVKSPGQRILIGLHGAIAVALRRRAAALPGGRTSHLQLQCWAFCPPATKASTRGGSGFWRTEPTFGRSSPQPAFTEPPPKNRNDHTAHQEESTLRVGIGGPKSAPARPTLIEMLCKAMLGELRPGRHF